MVRWAKLHPIEGRLSPVSSISASARTERECPAGPPFPLVRGGERDVTTDGMVSVLEPDEGTEPDPERTGGDALF